jgi:hypothetical protein
LICTNLAGCAAAPPGNPLPPESEADRVLGAMQMAAAGHEPGLALAPAASSRGRWEDVPLAVYWAIAEDGVEMGTTQAIEHDWGWEYRLKTVEGWPATLRIERRDHPAVFHATASVGRFPDQPERIARAERLVAAVERVMAALGRKPRPVEKRAD